MVTAPPAMPVKRSTFSAAAGPATASAMPIVSPASNDLEPLIVTPPFRIQSRLDLIAQE